ncbi:MAG: hypothetical protein ACKO2H_05380, partial [Bacteroidota bacterium]
MNRARYTSSIMRLVKRVPTLSQDTWEHFKDVDSDSEEQYVRPSIPRKIMCFWTGDNTMSDARKQAFDSLSTVSEINVELITKQNLQSYILEEYPL